MDDAQNITKDEMMLPRHATEKEPLTPDEQLIDNTFKQLLDDYLNSNHRRKIERITKAFNFANHGIDFHYLIVTLASQFQ